MLWIYAKICTLGKSTEVMTNRSLPQDGICMLNSPTLRQGVEKSECKENQYTLFGISYAICCNYIQLC